MWLELSILIVVAIVLLVIIGFTAWCDVERDSSGEPWEERFWPWDER